jgi:PPOX class probable FMN-dependent enzyme
MTTTGTGPTTDAELRTLYRRPGQGSLDKEVGHLDAHCRDFIAHAPFAVLATTDGDGRVDTSPKGGPPGFVSVLDDAHLAIPDMAGNNRLDSLGNIVRCGAVSVLFMVPQVGETLRVVGMGSLSTAPEVLGRCQVERMVPNVAIVVQVTTAYIHCAKALRRSGLWEPERWPDVTDMASPACMLRDHMRLERTADEMQQYLDEAYVRTTWAMGGAAPDTVPG